jgi:hypothetical protein
MRGIRRFTAALIGVACLVGSSSAAGETRDPALWPFRADSPWNTPIGSGAQFGSGACDADVQAQGTSTAGTWINAQKWGVPVYQAAASHPLKNVYLSENPWYPAAKVNQPSDPQTPVLPHGTKLGPWRMPSSMPPSPGGDDRAVVVVAPDHKWSTDMFETYPASTFVNVSAFSRYDLVNGTGWDESPGVWFGPHAANAAYIGGALRQWEATAGQFRHALAVSLPHSRLSPDPNGFIPPATSQDGADGDYSGSVHMGQLLALPSDVDINSLGLVSPAGRAIATALQRYGGYVIDGGGALALWAEPSTDAYFAPARQGTNGVSDMMRITQRLRCVTNNVPGSWGGGGIPLAPAAPPFDPQYLG